MTEKAHILVVEDETIVAMEIKDRLEGFGYAVCGMVSTGEAAVEMALAMRPDLVFMDIRLKGEMDGVQAAQEIRARFDIPVVYLTAYADEDTLRRAKIAEPFGYIIKPFQERDLRSAVEIALYRHGMEKRLKESKRWLAAVLRSIGDAVITADATGKITFVNQVAEALTGWKQEHALSKDLMAVFHIVNEDTSMPADNLVAKALREGVVTGLANHSVLIAKDGRETPIDDSAAPIRDENGNITGIVLVFRDITERKRAEETLRNSEERHRRLIESSEDMIFSVDRTGILKTAGGVRLREFGLKPEDVIGHSLIDLFREEAEQYAARHREVFESGVSITYENAFEFRGMTRTDLTTVYPIKNERGEVELVGIICRDITEAKKAEEEIKRLKEFNEGIVQNMTEGIVVTNAEGRHTFVNYAAARMLGYSPDELVGKHWTTIVPSDSQPMVRAADERRKRGQSDQYDLELVHMDGTRLPVLASASPCFENGEFAGTLAVFANIAELKRTEQALRESDQRFRQVAENAEEWIWEVDTDGLYTYASPVVEKILGYRAEEIVGRKHFYDLFHPEDKEELQGAALEAVSRKESFREFINRNMHKNGRPVWLSTSASPILDEKGNLLGYRGADSDITERKRLEQHLRQAAKMEAIGHLAGGIAHDFNNLLTGILGYANMLRLESDKDSSTHEAAETIEKSARRMAELTAQLLGFARKGKYRIVPVDLHETIREVVRMLGRTVDKNIQLMLAFQAENATTMGDPAQMEQIFLNLAINARDSMPDGGTMTFSTEIVELDDEYSLAHPGTAPDRRLLVAVTDTGSGIPKYDIGHVFEPFFTTKEKGRGTGMGLAMVYGIVKNHGGNIQAYSEVGHGTAFKVYLPLADAEGILLGGEKQDRICRGVGNILVVDDEEVVRNVASEMLFKLGYEVVTTSSGQDAVDYYRKHGDLVDLVIIDLIMPGMGGQECFRELKCIDPHVRAVLSTGYGMDRRVRDIVNEGMIGFVQKPYQMIELGKRLHEFLAD